MAQLRKSKRSAEMSHLKSHSIKANIKRTEEKLQLMQFSMDHTSDAIFPGGMGGIETIKKLKEIDPNVKAIVSSGYSNHPVMSNLEEYGFKGVIAKPYKPQELREILQEVLEG